MRTSADSDFPRDFARAACVPGASKIEVWKRFRPVAKELRRTCRRAASLGVRVKLDATLHDVRHLFEYCRVVTLFGHCRLEFLKENAIKDPRSLVNRFEDTGSSPARPECAAFADEVARRWRTARAENRALNPYTAASICYFINELLEEEYCGVYERYHSARRSRSDVDDAKVLVRFSLNDFEAAFPDSIVPSQVVDFADGPRSIEDIAGLIPEGFSGVADFSICYSSIVAEILKGRGRDRKPCVVVVNRPQSSIRARARIYGTTIELLAAPDACLSYQEAIGKLAALIEDWASAPQGKQTVGWTSKSVLRKHWEATQALEKEALAGGARADKSLTAEQAAALRTDLTAALRRNRGLMWIAMSLIVLLGLATIYVLLFRLSDASLVKWVSLGSGGVCAFLVPAATRIWREVYRLEMLIVMATAIQGEALAALLRLLLESDMGTKRQRR
jgi:hypothetical protein